MINWIEWLPALVNVIAYGAGQFVGHRQGSSIRPQASEVLTEVAKAVADCLQSNHEALGQATEQAAGQAADAIVTPKLPSPPKGPTL